MSGAQTRYKALVPKPIAQNNVVPNPYMAANESIVHNDAYSSDVSGGVVPLGCFVPSQDDTQPYSIQISYSFVDQLGNIVVPTTTAM
ncbi:hypothetical protein [Candidatus Soleaferrea massiliensis]|uniref:hypothetical protein n=1 Tax=Candidatus Soleaferrea massiliensis TaxID=1470354 RepID=UPI000693B1E8|nr:hypothetical protein [Candidatus Soleaferrea massiliensis]